MNTPRLVKNFVILGGGTAGWMAANIMAKRWADKPFKITLIESPDIGTIGVGEGSTPQLKSFFDYIDVDESEWMPACNATYKNGIAFKGWSTYSNFEEYFHPFPAQPDDYSAPAFFYNAFVRRKGIDVVAHPDHFFLATYLAQHGLSPKPRENFPFDVGYGYHFDSSLLGKFLCNKAVARGVVHRENKVAEVQLTESGDIASLQLDSGESISADFFVDATGFSGLLIQKKLQVPFVSFANNLFNDSAVVIPTPTNDLLPPYTTATALKNGWMWNIPLANRVGNGYVFSSKFCTSDQAETELRKTLGMLDASTNARHLTMKVGRVAKHWEKNCLAVGLSQGFIEPLEATALHLVQETVQGFVEAYEAGNFSNQEQETFNKSINQRFEGVRDYIVCHYRVNSRKDSEYWLANAGNQQLSASLSGVINCWVSGGNVSQEIERQKISGYYSSVSWHCLLAGYGVFPTQDQLVAGNEQAHKHDLVKIREYLRRCALNFNSHKALIDSRFV